MSKKSFRDAIQKKAINPTMQFISASEPVEEEQTKTTEIQILKKPTPEPKRLEVEIVREAEGQPEAKRLPEETKTRRLQLLLTPSLYGAVKDKADAERVSVNELINAILRDAMRK